MAFRIILQILRTIVLHETETKLENSEDLICTILTVKGVASCFSLKKVSKCCIFG